MDRGKLFQKIAYSVIGLAVVVLVGLTLYQRHLIKSLSNNSSPKAAVAESANNSGSPAGQEAAADTVKTPQASGGEEATDLNYQLNAAEEEVDIAQNQLSNELQKKAEFKKNMIEMQKKMFQDPEQRKMIRSTIKAQMDTLYGALFKKLGLTGEKLDAFKDLLADQQLAVAELNMNSLDASTSKEKTSETAARQKSIEAEYDGKVADLLGENGSTQYTAYKETLSERSVVTPFLESLDENQKLTDSQQEVLISAMHDERKKAEASLPFDEKAISPTELNETEISKIIEHNDKVMEGYMNSAKNLLSKTQAEQLQNYLTRQRETQITALKMASQMFGNGSSSQPPAEKQSTSTN